jgi:Host cell surface-exposed lipoprotein
MKKLVAVSAIAIIGGLTACKGSTPVAVSSAPAVSTSAPAAAPTTATDPLGFACAVLDSNGYCSSDDPSASATTSAPAATAAPAISAAEQQAVDSAQSYLALGQGFSKAGLLKQLTSSYGAGFTAANAQFAINYLKPDWDAQAVLSAKSYLALGQGFSHAGLIQQLTSSYGAGFTQAQAEYAVSKVGL